MEFTIKTWAFIWFSVCCYLVGLASGYFPTKMWYRRIIDVMVLKNQNLIERVKKAEGIILHDLLQLSPDDIDLLKKNMEGDVTKSATKE